MRARIAGHARAPRTTHLVSYPHSHPPSTLCASLCTASLYGDIVAETDALGGFLSLKEAVATFKEQGKSNLTALVPRLQGVDPDDAFSRVPYENGASQSGLCRGPV